MEKKQLTPREQQINDGFANQHKMIQSLFGDKDKAAKFTATAVKVANDYKLNECYPQSILDACINVAQLGLDLSPNMAHAYLVPFKKNVQLIVSARGYTALLARTGWSVKSFIVTDADEFDYRMNGFEDTVTFVKDLDTTDAKFRYAVAMAKSPNGELFVEVMNNSQIEKHRLVSSNQSGAKSGVWLEWFDEMAKKTVIKKLVKKLPIGEQIADVVAADDKPIEAEIIEQTIDNKKSGMDGLK